MPRPPLNPVIAKDVLFEVADILDEGGLPFFLICGTALGAHRDKGFVPSDNDIDLGYLIEDMTWMIKTITSRFESAGFGVSHVLQGTTDKRETRAFCVDKSGVHVDLVGWSKNRNDRYIMASSKNRALVHPAGVIENPSPVVMFGRTFMMPSPHETYLRHEYGPDFMTPRPDYHKSSSRISNYKPDEIDIKSLLKRDVGSAHLDKIYSDDVNYYAYLNDTEMVEKGWKPVNDWIATKWGNRNKCVSILDVGCGVATPLRVFDFNYSYHGFDGSTSAIKSATALWTKKTATFEVARVDKFKTDKRFDIVIFGSMDYLLMGGARVQFIEHFLAMTGAPYFVFMDLDKRKTDDLAAKYSRLYMQSFTVAVENIPEVKKHRRIEIYAA